MLNAGLAILTLLYPLAVYFSMEHLQPRHIALMLLVVCVGRILLTFKSFGIKETVSETIDGKEKNNKDFFQALLLGAIFFFALLATLADSESLLLFYPVLVNGVIFVVFAYTLKRPPSMIERFARLQDPDLPQAAIAYTGKVTVVWCAFFIFNGLFALFTALFASLAFWSLYNGLISYLLVGALFFGEMIIRRFVQEP